MNLMLWYVIKNNINLVIGHFVYWLKGIWNQKVWVDVMIPVTGSWKIA